jgi:hypothetical protein
VVEKKLSRLQRGAFAIIAELELYEETVAVLAVRSQRKIESGDERGVPRNQGNLLCSDKTNAPDTN